MKDTLKKWLGFNHQNEFTKEFYYRRNILGTISMSVVVIGLEIWMCLSLFKYMYDRDKVSAAFYISHGYHYFVLLGTAIVMLCFGVRFFRRGARAHRSKLGGFMVGLYCIVCLWFGTYYGLRSYSKSEQSFAYTTMMLFVFCLLVWRPFVGGLFSAATCLYFYHECCIMSDIEMTYSFQVNFFTLWIVMFMFILSNYRITINQAEKDESLIRQATEDKLTGLLNQNGFDKAVSDRRGEYILLVNLENFKAYNETYGLAEGDALLKKLAVRLKEIWGDVPMARLHGDRFAILTPIEDQEGKAQQLASSVQEISLAKKVHLEAKIGACALEATPAITLDNARFACASLHHKAGAILQVYDDDFNNIVEMRQFVIGNIVSAIDLGHIRAYFQPINDPLTHKVIGYEALARWQDPERGMLQPISFIPTLEEFRLIPLLDKEIMRQAAEVLHAKIESGSPVVPISVNISQVDFDIFNICDYLVATLDRYQVPHELLEVEITESALSDHPEVKKQLLEQLRSEGFAIWLDDFGSGYSSLNVLKEFRFDVLKIDMIFMREFGKYEKTKEIVQSIINLAGKLGVRTLTEGVETEEQAAFLTEAGCDMLQGFLFAKPMEVRDIDEFLNK